jgi:superoxide dismutase, Cu-Zn family
VGEHAFHVHAVGKCEPPFTSAGGHFNPGNKKHGLMAGSSRRRHAQPAHPRERRIVCRSVEHRHHAGKGPNSIFDADGSAPVMHANKDDYKTDRTGEVGGCIACGVLEQ